MEGRKTEFAKQFIRELSSVIPSKKRFCELIGVHPKSLYKVNKGRKSGKMRIKDKDRKVLSGIRSVIKDRPTYGYKRVTALYNRERVGKGLEKHNKKRIYRIMKENGLLLPKTGKSRAVHKGTGKVMTLHSNTRWCSDCFEVHCFNGEKVYVSFVLDTCDRQVLSWTAFSRPLLSEDIQALMISAVEGRFGGCRTDREIEFLSDRGSIYRAYNVQVLARRLGLKSCFTRAYSPESNGMAEAFVKTIKRDYVYVNDCSCAEKTMKLLEKWIYDYNHKAPHSALDMRSPVEYIKSNQPG